MAEAITLTGIILSSMPIGENDRRLVILTREYGKISAFARGARKANSTMVGSTRSFVLGTFTLYQGRDSYSCYKVEVKEYFNELLTDLDALYYACYFAEIADYYSRENLDAKDMINLLYMSIKALINDNIPNSLVRLIYELRVIHINGEAPDVFDQERFSNMNPSTLYAMQYIVSSDIRKLYSFNLKDENYRELKKFVERLRIETFDKNFNSESMLPAD